MIEIPYTLKNLLHCIQYRDFIKDKSLYPHEKRLAAATLAAQQLYANQIFSQDLRPLKIAGKEGFAFCTLSDSLVARLISQNIRTTYRIKQNDRNKIIKMIVHHLKDGSPAYITKLDISNFYESIDRPRFFNKILSDGKLSRQTLELISVFFKTLKKQDIKGLPRGVGLSAVLAELSLKDLDEQFYKDKNVFYYTRYVDDIFVLSSTPTINKDIESRCIESLPAGLAINREKTKSYEIKKAILKIEDMNSNFTDIKIDFLGYEFKAKNYYSQDDMCLNNKNRALELHISGKKIERIKRKIILSFTNFLSTGYTSASFNLLCNRISCLTGNYSISDPVTGIKIKTGIYYNYLHITPESPSLKVLDAFLKGLLFSKRHPLSQRIISVLPKNQRIKLSHYSFVDGFINKKFYSFDYKSLKKIKGCWRNA
jgi:hypothetical protein